ncbi:transcriptional repressor [Coemansia spiralis]|uniref:Transcriptional repressor n=1 Tax=Coemansia spiralis TaxID=417178 RepID=A0A9W8G2R3_9FUNG|nr:transcriptional repressor [Coemansia spiralis]
MSTSTPNSPSPAALSSSSRSTPGPATRTPMHLGLAGHSAAARNASAAPRRTVPSLSIRTADGSRVSILNDCDDSSDASGVPDHKRCSSVPGLSPGSSPTSASPFRAQSTPGATTPQQQPPSMLPSLSTLVQAVHMVSSSSLPSGSTPMKRSISSSSVRSSSGSSSSSLHHHPYYHSSHAAHTHNSHHQHRYQQQQQQQPQGPPSSHHLHQHHSYAKAEPQSPVSVSTPPASAPPAATAAPVPAYASAAPAGTKSTGKRKYKCIYAGCGKAFTTSGHLARHQRIHTGEKNFPCLFLGCTSRFSRQDNMMQHYRTHLSTKSRRNASPRKVVFVEQANDQYRAAHSMYASQVYSGSHPIEHHQQHRPYGPPSQRTSAVSAPSGGPGSAAGPPQQGAVGGGHKTHYGLPSVHMLSGSGGAAGSSTSHPHEFHHSGIAKQSPAVAHSGTMSFY